MKRWLFVFIGVILSVFVLVLFNIKTPMLDTVQSTISPKLSAPEFTGIVGWLNSEPLTMGSLRGKVVLIDFWTYSCINCIRTLPYITSWDQKYRDKGLVIVGVHTPEFEFEKEKANVQMAIEKYGIKYPVAMDNNYGTWRAYSNRYWPAKYFINKDGRVVHTHFGEGDYETSEKVIQKLLAEIGSDVSSKGTVEEKEVPFAAGQTPETYLGLARMENFSSRESPRRGENAYTFPQSLSKNQFALEGSWILDDEFAQAKSEEAKLKIRFRAKDVYLVMVSKEPAAVNVFLKEKEGFGVDAKGGMMKVSESRLYHLISLSEASEDELTLEFMTPGVRLFAFTFGS